MNHNQSKILLRRFLVSLLMIFLLISAVFFMMHLLPGNPFQQYYSPKLGDELAEQIKKEFGFDRPINFSIFSMAEKYFEWRFWLFFNLQKTCD